MKEIAVIGYGALGKILVSALLDRLKGDYRLVGIYDQVLEGDSLQVDGETVPLFPSFDALIDSAADLVVEIAGVGAVKAYGERILRAHKDLVITSVGSLADEDLLAQLVKTAKASEQKVHITSGALGGFDIMRTLYLMGGATTEVQSTKAPKSLNGAPYLVTCGAEQTRVRLVSDPGKSGNTHRVTVENPSAKATIEITSKVDPKNPKSSVTAAWSVLALLQNLASPIQFF